MRFDSHPAAARRRPAFSFRHPLPRLAVAVAGCLALHAGAAVVEIRSTGSDGKPLPDTVVFLESTAAKAAAKPMQGVEVEQAARQFTNRVTVVTAGTEVRFPNRDTVRHHVYSFSPIKPFELKLYAGTPANPVLFDKPGIAALGCNIHDKMVAWILVVETPHHAQTGPQAVARIDNVPAGSYRLRSWHPGLPPGAPAAEQTLVVGAGSATASVQLPLVAGSL